MCLCTCGATACYVETLICVKHLVLRRAWCSHVVNLCHHALLCSTRARSIRPMTERARAACHRPLPKFEQIWRSSQKSGEVRASHSLVVRKHNDHQRKQKLGPSGE
mgnify:CR=1 FL=1